MKQKSILVFLFVVLGVNSYAQKKIYVDCALQKTTKSKAIFVFEINGKENGRFNRSVFLKASNLLLEKGFCKKYKGHFLRDGWYTFYDENGKKASQGYYLNGEKDGKWSYFDSTQTIFLNKDFKNGNLIKSYYEFKHLLNGKDQKFDSLGRLLSSYPVSNFKRNGYCAEYYPNRQLKFKGFYENDTPKKSWYYYSPKGKLQELKQYNNDGIVTKQNIYDTLSQRNFVSYGSPFEGMQCFVLMVTLNSMVKPWEEKKDQLDTVVIKYEIDIDGSIFNIILKKWKKNKYGLKRYNLNKTALLLSPRWQPYTPFGEKMVTYNILGYNTTKKIKKQ